MLNSRIKDFILEIKIICHRAQHLKKKKRMNYFIGLFHVPNEDVDLENMINFNKIFWRASSML